jgi:thiamine kinase-like enzyme
MTPAERAAALPIWCSKVEPVPLKGGITNTNFLVQDRGRRCFVRIGQDIPVHGVLRFNELAAARAAEAAGISPLIIHAEPGVLVTDFIEGRTFDAADVRANLARIVPLVQRVHRELPNHLRGPVLAFWVFHVIRDYAATIREGRHPAAAELPRLLEMAQELERRVGAIELVFGHNDLLPGNFLDDGSRLWLVDWDYAGFNSPLFDLGGLASNNAFPSDLEGEMLERYYGRPADHGLKRRYAAMKCASLLRETLWSLVSELHSTLDFDFKAYTAENRRRFEAAWDAIQ